MPKVVLFKLSENVSTAAAAINVTEAGLNSKAIVSDIGLAGKSVQKVGGMCTDKSGNIYVSDEEQHVIVKVTESGNVNVIAGLAGTPGNNGSLQGVTAANARFNQPKGLACDNSGNIYVADYGNNQIRVIKEGKVSVYAGNGSQIAGLVDSTSDPLQARFSHPSDVAVDNSGVVYVADTDNHAVRKVLSSQVLTLAGGGSAADVYNIQANKNIPFCDSPRGIAVDANGNIILCDTGNDVIKKITPKGWIYRHSGSGVAGSALGTGAEPAYNCQYNHPTYIAVDRSGYQYVIDASDSGSAARVVKVTPNGVPANVVDFSAATTSNAGVIGVAVSPAGKVFVSITLDDEAFSSSSSSSVDSSSSSSSIDSSSSSSSSSSSGGYSSSSSSSPGL